MGVYSVDNLMAQARKLAADYRKATGQPLAVSGEIAKHDAMRLLHLEANKDTQGGYDAIGTESSLTGKRIQIKGRAIFNEAKSGQRIGQLKLEQAWDVVVLVLMDEEFNTVEIFAADREAILEAMEESRNSNRSKRGAMSVARFKAIATLVWTQEDGLLEAGLWSKKVDD